MHTSASLAQKQAPLFQSLDLVCHAPAKSRLEKVLRAHARNIPAGRPLGAEGDRSGLVLCVMGGWLALSKSLYNGERQIMDFALPGDIIHPSTADGATSAVTMEALSDAVVAFFPEAKWREMKVEWPDLQRLEHHILAAERARRYERILRLGKGSAAMRISYSLLEFLVRLTAIRQSQNGAFHIPLRQQDLGDFAGLSSVHVCRTLRSLARDGIITVKGQMDIRILDLPALSRVANLDPETLSRAIEPK